MINDIENVVFQDKGCYSPEGYSTRFLQPFILFFIPLHMLNFHTLLQCVPNGNTPQGYQPLNSARTMTSRDGHPTA